MFLPFGRRRSLSTAVLAVTVGLILSGCTSLDSVLSPDPEHEGPTTTTRSPSTPNDDETTTAPAPSTTSSSTSINQDPITELSGALAAVVENRLPHDTASHTEGLEVLDGHLFESTGLYGSSSRRQIDLSNGSIISQVALEPGLHARGLTFHNGTGIQVSFHEGTGILFDPADLSEFDRFPIEPDGWGVCATAESLLFSNGSNTITVRDPMSFAAVDTITVFRDGSAVSGLGELECVGTEVWSTVWPTNELVRFNMDGMVTAWVDLSALAPEGLAPEDTVGGVAYSPDSGHLLVTGKKWPDLVEISLAQES